MKASEKWVLTRPTTTCYFSGFKISQRKRLQIEDSYRYNLRLYLRTYESGGHSLGSLKVTSSVFLN